MREPYCTLDDVYLLGLTAQAFVVYPRPFDAVDAATATIRIKAHSMNALDVVTFEKTSGGTLPTGITEFVAYGPLPVTSDLFRLSLTQGGSPIASWASAGDGWGITIDPIRRIQAHMVETASEIDEHLTAHEPPILRDPTTHLFPQILVGLNARMAARAAVLSLQIENDQYRVAKDRLFAREEQDLAMLKDWKAGKPIQPRPTDETTEVPENGAVAVSGRGTNWLNCGVL